MAENAPRLVFCCWSYHFLVLHGPISISDCEAHIFNMDVNASALLMSQFQAIATFDNEGCFYELT